MAALTTLEEKLAEVTGLAGAAQETTKKLNEQAGEGVRELVDWALPIQARHLHGIRDGSLALAADEDPNAS
jgi:hypothetical protein